MAYYELTKDQINENVVFVQLCALMKKFGLSRTTVHYHVTTDMVDAFRFRNRTYFKPDAVAWYEKLSKSGLLE